MRISSPRIVALNGGERMSLAFGSAIIRSIRVIRVRFALRLTPLPVCRERSNAFDQSVVLVNQHRATRATFAEAALQQLRTLLVSLVEMRSS